MAHQATETGDRLAELYEMLARTRAMTHEIERRIAEEEGMPSAAVVARRRHALHVVA